MSDAFLPPVIVYVEGDIRNLLAKLAEAEEALSAFAEKTYDARLSASDAEALAKIQGAERAGDEFARKTYTSHLSADAKRVLASVNAAEAEGRKFSTKEYEARLGATDKEFASKVAVAEAEGTKFSKKEYQANLGASAKDFGTKVAAAEAEGTKFSKKEYAAHLAANQKLLLAEIATADAELKAFASKVTNAKLGAEVDQKSVLAAIAEMRSLLGRMKAGTLQVKTDADLRSAMASVAELKALISTQSATLKVKTDSSLGSVLASVVSSIFTAKALQSLLWGKSGGIFGFGAGLAALGSLGSFAGFGVEHAVITVGSVAALAIEGLAGGALKLLGSLGTSVVGLGSNALVGSSAIADTEAMYKLLAANPSTSYASAMKQLNLPQDAGTKAEWANALAVEALNSYWDTATSSARTAASKLYSNFLIVAQHYIPLINTAATQNFKALTQGLQPLFHWLDSMGTVKNPGGERIFKTLESDYLKRLPIVIQAITQAAEAIGKIIDYVATYKNTGSLLTELLNFFTRLNKETTATGGNKTVNNLLEDWQVIRNFVKSVFDDLKDLFKEDPHTARAALQDLTGMFQELGRFLQSVQGKQDVSKIFAVHKQELLALLNVLPSFAKAFAGLYMDIAPSAVKGATLAIEGISKALNALVRIPDVGPVLAGVALVLWRVGALGGALRGLNSAIASLLRNLTASALEKLGLGGLASKIKGAGTPNAQLSAAAKALSGAAGDLSEAATKLSGAAGAEDDAAANQDVAATELGASGAAGKLLTVVGKYGPAVAVFALAVKEWHAVVGGLGKEKPQEHGTSSYGKGGAQGITNKQVQATVPADLNYMLQAYADILAGKNIPAALLNKIESAQGSGADVGALAGLRKESKAQQQEDILSILASMYSTKGLSSQQKAAISSLGDSIITALTNELKKDHPSKAMLKQADAIIATAKRAFKSHSPSLVFEEIGRNNIQGLVVGMSDLSAVDAAMTTMANAVISKAKDLAPRVRGALGLGTASVALTLPRSPAVASLPRPLSPSGTGAPNISIRSEVTIHVTGGMPSMANGSDFRKQLKKELDDRDRRLVQALRAGRY